jgi:CubicO group peptidase (beta-lactamase class C family)
MQARPSSLPLSVAATLAALVTLAAAQSPAVETPRVADVPELAGLAERWSAALKSLDAPGFALAVVMDGQVLALDAFGVRNVAGEPATPDTCYYIASATKPFTAMAVCLLAGEGKLDLDAPVKEVLPQLELPDEELTRKLTVRDLLCHRLGIDCNPIVQRDAYTGQITDEIYFELLREAEIAHEVRYSNVHFTLAGRVIEAVSGKKWQDFLAQHLFARAGMTRTTAYASEMYGKGEHAEPMLLVDGKWVRSALVKTDRTMHAAGGMGTTARDAARWLILNTNGGELDHERLLPEAMAREYYTQQSAHPRSGRIRIEEGFALGWNTGKYRDSSRPYFFHGGGYVGAASYFCFLPNERIGVAVLVNTGAGGSDVATIVSIDVLDRLLGVEGQPDLLPTYADGARKRRDDPRNLLPKGANPAKAPGGLSRPVEEYAGTYANPLEGELEVVVEHGELTAHSGELPYVLVSSGPDEFTACIVPGMTQTGGFELDSGGAVVAVTMDFDGGLRRFERVGAGGPRNKGEARFSAETYVGAYQAPEYTCAVRAKNGKLFIQMTKPEQPELELESAGQHKFQVTSAGARFVFEVADGSATGFKLLQDGQSIAFRRVAR